MGRHWRIWSLSVLLMLVCVPSALAMPITGHAMGTVTLDQSYPNGAHRDQPYVFTVGESVSVDYTYDPDIIPSGDASSVLRIDIVTGSGFRFVWVPPAPNTVTFGSMVVRTPDGDLVSLGASSVSREVLLLFPGGGDSGTLRYTRELGLGNEGFIASVVQAVPEPSSLVLGLIGGVVVLVLCRRKSGTMVPVLKGSD